MAVAVRRSYRNVEAEVEALAAEWRRMCRCIPEPVAFDAVDELLRAEFRQCPSHGCVFDPETALVFERGEWRPVAACGGPLWLP